MSDLFQSHDRRYRLTLNFIRESASPPADILDLGGPNPFSEILKKDGFNVTNTHFDLDRHPEQLEEFNAGVITAFEIFEHLLNPLTVLEKLPGNRLFSSVPLDLWFSPAYSNREEAWDRHFHEFEDWQFDWLIEHAGWKIIRREKWTNPIKKLGFRPVLRLFTPRWYVIEAIRK